MVSSLSAAEQPTLFGGDGPTSLFMFMTKLAEGAHTSVTHNLQANSELQRSFDTKRFGFPEKVTRIFMNIHSRTLIFLGTILPISCVLGEQARSLLI